MKPPRAEEPAAGKPVGIWIRVSTEDQVKGDSPEHHERRCRSYAESRGWNVREVYRLDAVSGKAVMGAPETQRMLSDVRGGRIAALVFSKLARLARNTRELLDFADIFREHQVDLVSLQESIDTSTPAGRLFFTVLPALAQFEREEIADRVAASVPIRAKLGKSLGGAAPFGYQWVNRQLVPNPNEAPIRKLMYELFLKHRRRKTVARLLNEAGHRTRNGSKFSDTTVERLIRDPIAKGLRRANYTRSLGEKKHWVVKPEAEWVVSTVGPVVSAELWDQCNALLDERRGMRRPPAKKAVHLFAGLVYCQCGQKMRVPSNSPKFICSACKNRIPEADLEAVFQEQLKGFLLSPEDIANYLEQTNEQIKQRLEVAANLETERQKLSQEMAKVYKLYVDDQISPDGFGRVYGPLENRLKQIDDELPRLQAEADVLKIQYLSRDEIFSEARDVYARWGDLAGEEKHRIVEAITERIVVGKDEVSITLHGISPNQHPPPPSLNPDLLAMKPQGFIAAISWKRAGSRSVPRLRAMVTERSSSG